MTLLKQFNQALKDLPIWANDIKFAIGMSHWSVKKHEHALEIIEQLKCRVIVHSYGDSIGFSTLNIILTPKECGLSSAIFGADSVKDGIAYVKTLLDDINSISPKIKFSLKDYYAESKYIKCFIEFEF